MTMFSSVSVVIVLSCALFAVAHADVSSLRYNRIGRVQSTRLQRQEASPTPYPAAGYRPDRQFDFPAQRQPQLASAAEPQQTNFDQLSPAQEPQLTYGAPVRQPSQPSQQQQQLRLLRAQQQQLQLQQREIEQLQQLVQQQQQEQDEQRQQQEQEQQRQQQDQQQQQQPQFAFATPQNTYGAPEASAEASESSQRLTKAKPARLTATREDVDDEEDDAPTDIDGDSNDAATATEDVNKPAARALPQPQPAPGAGTIVYYPAGAVSFVHPAAAAYGLQAAYKLPAANLFAKLQAQPAYYTAAAAAQPQLLATQQFLQPQTAAYVAASGQLQAW